MKPVLLEFAAFGPYVTPQKIDFRNLESNGIFLICGETGSGKTMLLDAMSFALYGKSSGDLRNDFKALRSTNARWEDITYVRFVFLVNGDYYRFERRLEPKLKKLSDKYLADIYMGEIDEEGNFEEALWNPLYENPKKSDLDNKAKQLIGLDYDQFRQVIILPQGQFEKLLVSGSDEKEKILSTIFGINKWQKIAEAYYVQAEKRKNELQDKKDAMMHSLAEEECASLDDLLQLITDTAEEKLTLESDYNSADYKKKLETLQEDLSLTEAFSVLDDAREQEKDLISRLPKQEERIKTLNLAQKAESIRPLLLDSELKTKEYIARNDNLTLMSEALDKTKEHVLSTKKNMDEHKKGQAQYEADRERRILCNNKKEDYASIEEARIGLHNCEKELKTQEEAENRIKNLADRLKKELDALVLEQKEISNRRSTMTDSYLRGIGGELAQSLTEGMPCPVCGSTSHPAKALLSADHVSKDELDEVAAEEADKLNEIEQKRLSKEKADKDLETQRNETVLTRTMLAAAQAKLTKATESLMDGIESLNDLEEEINRLDTVIDDYTRKSEQLSKLLEEVNTELTRQTKGYENAEEELNIAKDNLKFVEDKLAKAVKECGFETSEEARSYLLSEEQRSALSEKITEYQTRLSTIKATIESYVKKLAGKVNPDKTLIKHDIEEINEKEKQFASAMATLTQRETRLRKKYDELKQSYDVYSGQISEAEADFVFAKGLRGDTGTGLQRYVLGIMFDSVINAANEMLELVHKKRYYLVRTDDKEQGSNKRGLGLKAYDRYNADAEPRFVSTMSGGEKFLISLTLSIGLSTIARKSGIRIEALFIDEGFGSLDRDSIEDAMNVLDTVQKSNGILGIISHVQILRERISSKLVVDKNRGTSTIEYNIG